MRYRQFGHTGLMVSEICLGTMTFGGKGFWEVVGTLQQESVNEMVKTSFDAGINFIDTANVYSLGESEKLLGQAIKTLGLPREELVIATKVTGVMKELPNSTGQSRYHMMNEIDASLKRLQLDHVDLYQIHGFDPFTPLEETLSTLNDIVRSGKARYVGLCNLAAWQVMKSLAISDKRGWAKFDSVQAFYSIATRDLERELVPLIEDQKLGLMIWSPLAGGLMSGKYKPDGSAPKEARRTKIDFPIVDKDRAFRCIDVMRPIADQHGVSVAQIALAWILTKPFVSSVIIGAKTIDQLNDNIASHRVVLSESEISALNEVSKLPSEYPEWMIDRQSRYRVEE